MTIILNKQYWKLGNICLYPEEKMGTRAPHDKLAGPLLHRWEQELAFYGIFYRILKLQQYKENFSWF